jgi:hypothetical protein
MKTGNTYEDEHIYWLSLDRLNSANGTFTEVGQ